ncbi:hypothetical protein HPB50_015409 [Hyalomma asiaticum]|uniref:Uncharacterized protein n=1 Tax=Hyalomma asiaticum TaxID=266040 RepID=A0ACB7S3R9_HYAAI|nr:hypothetical protein HPB50_015409 [Hyalomma asiaticum]
MSQLFGTPASVTTRPNPQHCFVIADRRSFVPDAPVIQPLVFPSDVVTGVNTKLLCNVQRGTRPLNFAWLKDGASVSDGVSSQDDFSLLSIDPVTAESAGNYTCVVSNAAGTDRYTSTLEVKRK